MEIFVKTLQQSFTSELLFFLQREGKGHHSANRALTPRVLDVALGTGRASNGVCFAYALEMTALASFSQSGDLFDLSDNFRNRNWRHSDRW